MGLTDTLRQIRETHERMIGSAERAEEADRKMTAAAKRMRAAADEAEATAQTLHRRVSGLTWGLTILFASAAVIAGLVGGFVAGWLMMR